MPDELETAQFPPLPEGLAGEIYEAIKRLDPSHPAALEAHLNLVPHDRRLRIADRAKAIVHRARARLEERSVGAIEELVTLHALLLATLVEVSEHPGLEHAQSVILERLDVYDPTGVIREQVQAHAPRTRSGRRASDTHR